MPLRRFLRIFQGPQQWQLYTPYWASQCVVTEAASNQGWETMLRGTSTAPSAFGWEENRCPVWCVRWWLYVKELRRIYRSLQANHWRHTASSREFCQSTHFLPGYKNVANTLLCTGQSYALHWAVRIKTFPSDNGWRTWGFSLTLKVSPSSARIEPVTTDIPQSGINGHGSP